MSNFREFDRETRFLLPPSLDEWLPEQHLARFVVEVIDGLDLSAMVKSYRGTGSAGYHPVLLLGLLVYGYATGVFSSRRLERATYESVAVRFIAVNQHHGFVCLERVPPVLFYDAVQPDIVEVPVAGAYGVDGLVDVADNVPVGEQIYPLLSGHRHQRNNGQNDEPLHAVGNRTLEWVFRFMITLLCALLRAEVWAIDGPGG